MVPDCEMNGLLKTAEHFAFHGVDGQKTRWKSGYRGLGHRENAFNSIRKIELELIFCSRFNLGLQRRFFSGGILSWQFILNV